MVATTSGQISGLVVIVEPGREVGTQTCPPTHCPSGHERGTQMGTVGRGLGEIAGSRVENSGGAVRPLAPGSSFPTGLWAAAQASTPHRAPGAPYAGEWGALG